jgi:hypothetical protein
MRKFIKNYNNPEKFNEDFIYIKRNDDILEYVTHICKALEVLDGIKFLGATLDTDESKIKPRGRKNEYWVDIDESRLDVIHLKFEVSKKDQKEVIEKKLLFPKLINDFYFIIGNNRYYPIHQIIDAATYVTKDAVKLKTLLMPSSVKKEEIVVKDMDEEKEYNGFIFKINVFSKKINAFQYFFAKKGIQGTIDYFGLSENGRFNIIDVDDPHKDDYKYFKINNKIKIEIHEDLICKLTISYIAMIIELTNIRTGMDDLQDLPYWTKKLGARFTKNNTAQEEKGEGIIVSFERVLDGNTKKLLRLPEKDKTDMYSIMRWIVRNHHILAERDNMHLANKRLRVYEYLFYPLLRFFSNKTYWIMNRKIVKFKNLKSVVNISPGFILSSTINNELLRYSNTVNGIDLFSSALRFSKRGKQSYGEGGRNVATKYRGIHPTYIGKIGLNASSNSDPGMSGTFTPFLETEGFYFNAKAETPTFTDNKLKEGVLSDDGKPIY